MFTHSSSELTSAMDGRESLLAAGMFSYPQSEKCIAVVTSLAMNRVQMDSCEAEPLLAEKTAILDRFHKEGLSSEEVTNASVSDLVAVLTDPTITDICLIGEGSVGCIYARGGREDPSLGTTFDWRDVARAADHLKTGNIYQRMCSGLGFSPIPWGTFAIADIRKLWISDEPSFKPTEVHDRPEQGLSPAYDDDDILDHDTLYRLKQKLQSRKYKCIDNRGDNL